MWLSVILLIMSVACFGVVWFLQTYIERRYRTYPLWVRTWTWILLPAGIVLFGLMFATLLQDELFHQLISSDW